MQLNTQIKPLTEISADWLVVGVWEDEAPDGAVAELDRRIGGALSPLRQAGDVTGKANELTPVLGRSGGAAERILVVGLGKRAQADRYALIDAAAAAARSITSKPRGRVAFALPEAAGPLGWDA